MEEAAEKLYAYLKPSTLNFLNASNIRPIAKIAKLVTG
jgi:hypothetical protein